MAHLKNHKHHVLAAFLAVFSALSLSFLLAEPSLALVPLPEVDGPVPDPGQGTAIERAQNLLGPFARNFRIIIGGLAVVFITIAGFTMALGAENEETVKSQRSAITYTVAGLLLISIAGPIAQIFDFRSGNPIADPESLEVRAQLFDETTRMVVTFATYILGSLATLMFISAGATMVVGSQSEETVSRAKQNLALGAGGLLLVVFSDLIFRRIVFNTEIDQRNAQVVAFIDQNEFVRQIVAITNLLVQFVGPVFLLGAVGAGVLYVSANGNEERLELARKILINSVIGVVIIYGAFGLVSTVILGRF